jgi:hypothetical protein
MIVQLCVVDVSQWIRLTIDNDVMWHAVANNSLISGQGFFSEMCTTVEWRKQKIPASFQWFLDQDARDTNKDRRGVAVTQNDEWNGKVKDRESDARGKNTAMSRLMVLKDWFAMSLERAIYIQWLIRRFSQHKNSITVMMIDDVGNGGSRVESHHQWNHDDIARRSTPSQSIYVSLHLEPFVSSPRREVMPAFRASCIIRMSWLAQLLW